MNKKGKIFSLIGISGAMLFSFAFTGKNFDFLSARADYSNQIVSGSLVFTQPSIESNISNRYYSTGRTSGGKQLYLISVYPSNCEPDGSVINFGDATSDDVVFFVSEYQNGMDPVNGSDSVYRFQGINSVSFGIGNAGVCYGEYIVAPTSRSIDSDSATTKSVNLDNKVQNFSDPVHCVKFVKMHFMIATKASSISFNYNCDWDYVDSPHQVTKSCNPDGGTIMILSDSQLYDGEECSFTFTPKAGSDLTLNHFYIVDHDEIEIKTRVNQFGKIQYYFIMPNSDVTLSAVFDEPVKYNLTSNPTTNGSISISTSQYKAGATASFDVIPDSGYIIDSVSSSPSCSFNIQGNTYSFTMPTSDVEVSATFKEQAGPGPVESTTYYAQVGFVTKYNLTFVLNSDNTAVYSYQKNGTSTIKTYNLDYIRNDTVLTITYAESYSFSKTDPQYIIIPTTMTSSTVTVLSDSIQFNTYYDNGGTPELRTLYKV